jgi:ribosomal protein L40E
VSRAARRGAKRQRAKVSASSPSSTLEANRPPSPRQKNTDSAVVAAQGARICKKCGAFNKPDAKICATCGSARLAPTWVLARREVTKQFEVQITKSSERFGEPRPRITLSKWWPGSTGRSPSLHISTPEQWTRVREIVELDFGPRLGWHVLAGRGALPTAPLGKDELRELVHQNPELAREVLGDSADGARETWSPEAVALVERISREEAKLGRPFLDAYRALIERLPAEGGEALSKLEHLLESWSLQQITQLVSQIRQRLETIDLFERLVLDDKTYELKGDRSIHRVLESALWLVDERYWLMTSNRTLRTLIGRAIQKERRREMALRPDFACTQLGPQGVIIEIKRPKHRLMLADLNQAERYLVLAEEHTREMSWSATLIGQGVSADVQRTAKYRTAVVIRTFADLLADARNRYEDYLRIVRPARTTAATATGNE